MFCRVNPSITILLFATFFYICYLSVHPVTSSSSFLDLPCGTHDEYYLNESTTLRIITNDTTSTPYDRTHPCPEFIIKNKVVAGINIVLDKFQITKIVLQNVTYTRQIRVDGEPFFESATKQEKNRFASESSLLIDSVRANSDTPADETSQDVKRLVIVNFINVRTLDMRNCVLSTSNNDQVRPIVYLAHVTVLDSLSIKNNILTADTGGLLISRPQFGGSVEVMNNNITVDDRLRTSTLKRTDSRHVSVFKIEYPLVYHYQTSSSSSSSSSLISMIIKNNIFVLDLKKKDHFSVQPLRIYFQDGEKDVHYTQSSGKDSVMKMIYRDTISTFDFINNSLTFSGPFHDSEYSAYLRGLQLRGTIFYILDKVNISQNVFFVNFHMTGMCIDFTFASYPDNNVSKVDISNFYNPSDESSTISTSSSSVTISSNEFQFLNQYVDFDKLPASASDGGGWGTSVGFDFNIAPLTHYEIISITNNIMKKIQVIRDRASSGLDPTGVYGIRIMGPFHPSASVKSLVLTDNIFNLDQRSDPEQLVNAAVAVMFDGASLEVSELKVEHVTFSRNTVRLLDENKPQMFAGFVTYEASLANVKTVTIENNLINSTGIVFSQTCKPCRRPDLDSLPTWVIESMMTKDEIKSYYRYLKIRTMSVNGFQVYFSSSSSSSSASSSDTQVIVRNNRLQTSVPPFNTPVFQKYGIVMFSIGSDNINGPLHQSVVFEHNTLHIELSTRGIIPFSSSSSASTITTTATLTSSSLITSIGLKIGRSFIASHNRIEVEQNAVDSTIPIFFFFNRLAHSFVDTSSTIRFENNSILPVSSSSSFPIAPFSSSSSSGVMPKYYLRLGDIDSLTGGLVIDFINTSISDTSTFYLMSAMIVIRDSTLLPFGGPSIKPNNNNNDETSSRILQIKDNNIDQTSRDSQLSKFLWTSLLITQNKTESVFSKMTIQSNRMSVSREPECALDRHMVILLNHEEVGSHDDDDQLLTIDASTRCNTLSLAGSNPNPFDFSGFKERHHQQQRENSVVILNDDGCNFFDRQCLSKSPTLTASDQENRRGNTASKTTSTVDNNDEPSSPNVLVVSSTVSAALTTTSVVQSFSMASMAVGAAASPALGFSIGRQQAMMNYALKAQQGDCRGLMPATISSEEEEVDYSLAVADSPTQMKIGTQHPSSPAAPFYVGAVVGNFVMIFGIVLVNQLVGHIVTNVVVRKYCSPSQYAKQKDLWKNYFFVFANSFVSLSLFYMIAILLSPTLTSAVSILAGTSNEVVPVGVKIVCFLIAVLISSVGVYFVVWSTYIRKPRREVYRINKQEQEAAEKKKELGVKDLFNKLCKPDGEWKIPMNKRTEQELHAFQISEPCYATYRVNQWFAIVEIVVAVLLCLPPLFAQLASSGKSSCIVHGVLLFLILLVYTILLLWKNPKKLRIMRFFVPAMAIQQTVVVGMILIAVLTTDEDDNKNDPGAYSWLWKLIFVPLGFEGVLAVVAGVSSVFPFLMFLKKLSVRLLRLKRQDQPSIVREGGLSHMIEVRNEGKNKAPREVCNRHGRDHHHHHHHSSEAEMKERHKSSNNKTRTNLADLYYHDHKSDDGRFLRNHSSHHHHHSSHHDHHHHHHHHHQSSDRSPQRHHSSSSSSRNERHHHHRREEEHYHHRHSSSHKENNNHHPRRVRNEKERDDEEENTNRRSHHNHHHHHHRRNFDRRSPHTTTVRDDERTRTQRSTRNSNNSSSSNHRGKDHSKYL